MHLGVGDAYQSTGCTSLYKSTQIFQVAWYESASLKNFKQFADSFIIVPFQINKWATVFWICFCDVWDQHAPLITRMERRKRTPWITVNVLQSVHIRNATYKNFLKSRSNANFLIYKQHRNKTNCRGPPVISSRVNYAWKMSNYVLHYALILIKKCLLYAFHAHFY